MSNIVKWIEPGGPMVWWLVAHWCGAVVQWLSLLHNFILISLSSGSAEVQILLAVCRRFAIVSVAGDVAAGNKAKRFSSVNHTTITIHHHHHHWMKIGTLNKQKLNFATYSVLDLCEFLMLPLFCRRNLSLLDCRYLPNFWSSDQPKCLLFKHNYPKQNIVSDPVKTKGELVGHGCNWSYK